MQQAPVQMTVASSRRSEQWHMHTGGGSRGRVLSCIYGIVRFDIYDQVTKDPYMSAAAALFDTSSDRTAVAI
jgi:hypothetical protein